MIGNDLEAGGKQSAPSGISSRQQSPLGNLPKILIVLGLLLLIAVAGAAAWWRYSATQPVPAARVFSTGILLKTNSDFAQADTLKRSGDYAGALRSYKAALVKAKDPNQEATIQFSMAAVMVRAGDKAGAIDLFKQIASTISYVRLVRAYAVQYMGALYYNNAQDPLITKEIFKDGPYTSLYDPTKLSLSYRRLFEEAAALYPLAESEFYIARWYAANSSHSQSVASNSPDTLYKSMAEDRLAKGDIDLKRLQSAPAERPFIPETLLVRALAEGDLFHAGIATASEAETAYQAALASHTLIRTSPGNDWRARYLYAGFLSVSFGIARKADIIALLKPLYSSTIYAKSTMMPFLEAARSSSADSVVAKSLAKDDPDFMALLMSAGWQKSDFTS